MIKLLFVFLTYNCRIIKHSSHPAKTCFISITNWYITICHPPPQDIIERAKTHGFSFGFSVRHERFPAVLFLMHGGIHREKACKGTTFFWNVQILSKKSNNLWGFVNKLAYFLPKSDTHSSKYNALPPKLLLPYGGSDCVCWWHKSHILLFVSKLINLHEKCRFFCIYQMFFVSLQPIGCMTPNNKKWHKRN